MNLKVRPYGSDVENIRKMIERLGQELLERPEHGAQFLQPLKRQGVVEVDESAMCMPVTFMRRPGEQWRLRRLCLTRIHELFEPNGIKFPNLEVSVRFIKDFGDGRISEERKRAIGGWAACLIADDAATTMQDQ